MRGERFLDRTPTTAPAWSLALLRLALACLVLFLLTFAAWREMAHQWWDMDTYSHILLIPAIIGWLVWLRRHELLRIGPQSWWPGLFWVLAGLALWLGGMRLDINTLMQAGAVIQLQGAVLAILGLRAGLLLAFPLAYAFFLIPVGDEIIPPLQTVTALIATELSKLSGIDTVADGINIGTPAGLFIVAEECSGVKFLVAMIALGVLVSWTRFASTKRRAVFMLACVVVPILANCVRAWATIFIAQYVGAEAAGSFDHIVYGWLFFALVIALVLGVAWRWFERDPEEAGWTASEIETLAGVGRLEKDASGASPVLLALLAAAALFAVLARLG